MCGPGVAAQAREDEPRKTPSTVVRPGKSSMRRVPPPPRDDQPARFKLLPSLSGLSEDITVFELTLGELEDSRVAGPADREPPDVGAAECCCRSGGAGPDHLG